MSRIFSFFFFFNDTATTEISTLSLHDALPICPHLPGGGWAFQRANSYYPDLDDTAAVAWSMHRSTDPGRRPRCRRGDRKSTRLNSSHGYISYAVFCLKKKNKTHVHKKA